MYGSINTTTSSFYLQPDLRCPVGFINDVSQQNHIGFHLGQSPCATTNTAAAILSNSTITLSDLKEEEMMNKPAAEECHGAQFNKVRVIKDKHSKIVTAQGLRDRRVRLSIGIARRFFDLQDMLGFDKASKTVEWLFTKSQRAIDEIMLLSSYSSPTTNLFPNEGCKVTRFNVANSAFGDFHKASSLNKKAKRQTTSRKVPIQDLSKEKRKMARERARARTKEKLCAKRKFDEPKKCSQGTNSTDCTKVQGSLEQSHKEVVSQQPSREDLNEKLTPSSILNYQAKNWDISGVVSPSSYICRNSSLWQAVEGIQQSSKSIDARNVHLTLQARYTRL